ncbi:MAG: TonB-dependent receptor [Acidobacteria bacterium]|nr:TonB-dependent receptor [Acidobacteriota bacterium]
MNFSIARTKLFLFLGAMLFSVLLVNSVNAQSGTSSIRGTVTDPQGKIVAGATVTLKSQEKNYTRTQVTNSDGQYVFTAIPPDNYRIEIESTGFKKSVVENIAAQVDTPKNVDVTLELGQVSEVITVTGETEAQLNTTNGSMGATIGSRQIITLPLSARNTPDLLSLQAGVTPDGSVNGGRSDQANVTLDGVDVNEQQGGRAFFSVLRVTPESLQEFRVTTGNADANFGRSSGAQVSLVTKSGSNEWHGSGYFYFRPSKKFQANDFFNNLNGIDQLAQERRNYGGSVLGPIKKDRLFFAVFYERFEENSETPVTREVPLPSLGQGFIKYRTDGQAPAGTNGCTPAIANGVATLTIAQINACYTNAYGLTPGINPVALTFLAAAAGRYTANDSTVGDGLNTSGYRFNAKTPIRQNVVTTRLDGKLNAKQDVFARFQYQFDNSSAVSRFPDTLSPNTWIHPWGLAAGHTWTISNNMVNKFTYGFTRDSFTVGGDSQQNSVNFRYIFQPLNFSRTLSRVTPVHNFVDDFTWIRGNHTISLGANIRLISNQRTSFGSSFDSAVTNPSFYDFSGDVVINDDFGDPIFPNVGDGADIDLRDALTAAIGRFSQYSINLQYAKNGSLQALGQGVSRTFKTQEFEWYAQDSWRMFNNLTVNYGIRWSTSTPVYEADGLQVKPTTSLSDFFDSRVNGANNGSAYNGLLSVDLAGKANNRSGYYSQDWNNYAPAISAAWSPNFKNGFLKKLFGSEGKSSIRGGFRMTYDRIGSALAVAFDLNSTLGFSSTKAVAANTFNVSDRLGPLFSGLGQNYRAFPGLTLPPTLSFPLQTPADEDQRIEQSLDDNLTTPYSYTYNISYGREFGKGISIEASYVGRLGRKLLISRDTAHFNNLRDPATGQTFYSVMNTLLDYRAANAPITSIPNIAWFNKFVPGLAGVYNVCGTNVTLTATQAAYRRVARSAVNNNGTCIGGRNTNDYTFVQVLWDDGLGYGNNLFIHPQYATFAAYTTLGTSNYDSFQFKVRKRFEQGLQFDINYTWAHSIDTASGTESSGGIASGASLILNPLDLSANRGSSDFDVRHLINANFIYQLPFGKGRRFFGSAGRVLDAIIGGWQLTGIYRWNTGFPIGEPYDDGRWATNWNVQSNAVRLVKLEKSPTLNGPGGLPNIFTDPTAAYQSFRNARPGEAGDRNFLREPNYVVFDAGLYKSFKIKEGQSLTFRLEVFNVTNTQRLTGIANFAVELDPYLKTPPEDFGRLTNIQGAPRVVQFAFRYDF